MRRTGKIYSKKQLDEMFMNNSLESIIGNASIFDLLDAVLIVFGEDVRKEMDSKFETDADMTQWVLNLLNAATPEQKEEFLNELR